MEKKHIVEDLKKSQIDLLLLWRVLQGNFLKIIILAVVLAAALGIYRYTNSTPYYTVEAKFLMSGVTTTINKDGDIVIMPSIGLQANNTGASFAYNAPIMITSDYSVEQIADYLEKNKGSAYQMVNRRSIQSMLHVSVDGQTFTVSVSGVNRTSVLDVAEAVSGTVSETVDYFVGNMSQEIGDQNIESSASIAKIITEPREDMVRMTGRNVSLYAAIGFVAGALVVYLLCLFRTYFDNTVYSEEDLKNRFTIPVVGQIPTWENTQAGGKAFKDKSRRDRVKGVEDKKSPDSGNLMSDRDYEGRLLNKKTPFAITEAFKSLRTNLCYTTKGEKCAVYGVTSAYVSAGKSLIIANTAASFSQMEKRVLLVDADLRCPVQHKVFNLDNKVHGLSDLLAGICEFDDLYLRNGGYPNLDIITSGKIPPNPAELLASDNMKKFLATVRERYDVVFIDLPPVCEVSDAGIISDIITGFVFVVRAGYSDRRMIEMAVETMEGFDASFVGFVLNDIDIKSGDYYKNKYYSTYSKYRFRYGKGGYYRNHKYGYDKGYYARGGSYSRSYNRGYNNYSTSYSSNYSRSHDAVAEEEMQKNERNPLPNGTTHQAGGKMNETKKP